MAGLIHPKNNYLLLRNEQSKNHDNRQLLFTE